MRDAHGNFSIRCQACSPATCLTLRLGTGAVRVPGTVQYAGEDGIAHDSVTFPIATRTRYVGLGAQISLGCLPTEPSLMHGCRPLMVICRDRHANSKPCLVHSETKKVLKFFVTSNLVAHA